MQKTETAIQEQPASEQDVKPQLTPRQLYNYHLLHPNEPITDEDIRNLKIDSGSVFEDHKISGNEPVLDVGEEKRKSDTTEEENSDGERPIKSPYNILGGS